MKPASLGGASADEKAHIVSCGWPMGARSPTSSYGSPHTPGTLLVVKPSFETHELPLLPSEIKQLNYGDVRKLHPDELLAAILIMLLGRIGTGVSESLRSHLANYSTPGSTVQEILWSHVDLLDGLHVCAL